MTDPIAPDILVVYLDPDGIVQTVTLSQDNFTAVHTGCIVSASGESTGLVVFVPWSRILACENVNGGTMPLFP